MHEWALAEAVINAASEVAQKEGLTKVTEVRVKIGELQQIEPDILEFALENLRTPQFNDARFVLESVKAEFGCRVCGQRWAFTDERLDEHEKEDIHFIPEVAHAYVRCPKCGSSDFEILQGRGVWLESIKGVRKDG